MTWQLLTAISVLGFSISILLQRILIHKDKSDPMAYVIIFQGTVGVIITSYTLITGFKLPDVASLWPFMLMTFVLFGAAHIVYARTLQRVEASVFSILLATSAVWVMCLGLVVFRETIGAIELLGVVLIFVSIGLLVEHKGAVKLDRGILLGLLTGVLFGLATTNWVYVGKFSDPVTWTGISFLGPAAIVLLARPSSVKKMKPFLRKDTLIRIALLGIVYSVSAISAMFAYRSGNASVIAPLQQTSIIVTILLAYFFLGERQRFWHKALAALVCFAGILLIV